MLPVLRNNAPFAMAPINRLDSLFDRVFGGDGGFMSQAWSEMPLSMWEDDDHVWVEVELPGVTEKDLDVTVHRGLLSIQGERKPEEGHQYLYSGRTYGQFERVITLPEAVNTDEVQATLSDGILRIGLLKSPEAKPKKISLKTS